MKKIKLNKKMLFLISGIAFLLIFIIGICLLLVFNKPKEQPKTNKQPEKTEEQKKVQIIDEESKTRPYAIMINCHNDALPHAGLQDAYIVYELMVEGGITRMMALFKDVDVKKIGSIRSARIQYLDYVYENDAIYVHAGGAKDALNRISTERISHIDVDGQYGSRDTSLNRSWEHILFTNTDLLNKGVDDYKLRKVAEVKNLLKYTAEPIDFNAFSDKKEANNVSIKYSDYRTSIYRYDSDKKVYIRSMNTNSDNDLITGKQYEVKNIIIYSVKHTSYTQKKKNTVYQKLENVGTGKGYYISEGNAIPIRWKKDSKNGQTIYTVEETGKELIVNDGNTFIQIYPNNGNLIIK